MFGAGSRKLLNCYTFLQALGIKLTHQSNRVNLKHGFMISQLLVKPLPQTLSPETPQAKSPTLFNSVQNPIELLRPLKMKFLFLILQFQFQDLIVDGSNLTEIDFSLLKNVRYLKNLTLIHSNVHTMKNTSFSNAKYILDINLSHNNIIR